MTIHGASDATIRFSVTVPVTNDGSVPWKAKDERPQFRIGIAVVVQIPTQVLLTAAGENGFLTHRTEIIKSVAIPITSNQHVAATTQRLGRAGLAEDPIDLLLGIAISVDQPCIVSFSEKVTANAVAKISRSD